TAMLQQLAHTVIRRRRIVFAAWIVLSIVGAGFAGGIGDRLSQQFSIPGYSAYEANQRIFKENHTGKNYPMVPVFHSATGDIAKQPGLQRRIAAAAKLNPGARVSSYYNTGGSAAYLSKDRHTMFAVIYPAGAADFNGIKTLPKTRAALKQGLPAGVTANLTGQQALYDASGADQGSSLGLEIAIGAFGALVVLMFIFGTLPAVAMPLMIAAASILNTYTLITLLTTVMQVSVIVQFLVAIIGLGVAIDYSLLMIFRFREELAAGKDREEAVVQTMTHAGRAVVVSGTTVAIGLLSLVVLPLPFIRSIGTAGVRGAAAPTGPGWSGADYRLVEAFASVDASSKPARKIIDNLQDNVLPSVENQVDKGTAITLAGQAPEDRDFVHAVYGKFPEMFAFVIVLTLLLLARAFRSLILPIKAVILNLLSLAA